MKPEGEEIHVGAKSKENRCSKRQGAERTFDNWLEGYAVFIGAMQAAYPERGWLLNNHYRNLLQARKLADDAAAIAYDEAFRKRASQSASIRWDQL